MEKLIEVKNLNYIYPATADHPAEQALFDVSFHVKKGEFLGIIGHNGSGKSTLAKILNAIIMPTSGDVFIAGHNTKDETKLWDIRQTAGMVFQNPDNQLVATIVEDDVAFGPENLGVMPDEIRQRVDEALKTVDMYDYREKKPHQLSGGQKQRIAIAGILAMEPDCIIFDEPTAMLDPFGRKDVMSTIGKLNQNREMTVLHITHYMTELTHADRIIVLDHGRILMEGTPKEVFSQVEKLHEIGLDVPQMTELSHALRLKGYDIPADILTIDEMADSIWHLK